MAQQPQQQVQIQIEHIDRPEVSETYVDSVGNTMFDGQNMRLELCITRMNDPHGSKALTGRQYPASRLILPISVIIELANRFQQTLSMLEQQGVIKKTYLRLALSFHLDTSQFSACASACPSALNALEASHA